MGEAGGWNCLGWPQGNFELPEKVMEGLQRISEWTSLNGCQQSQPEGLRMNKVCGSLGLVLEAIKENEFTGKEKPAPQRKMNNSKRF